MINFFEFTDKGFEIIDDTFLLYEPFKKIWSRDKTPNKTVVTEELKYIFFICDFRSRGIWQGYKGIDLIQYARTHTNLPEDWKEDKAIKDCMLIYLNENDFIKTKVFKSLIASLSTTNRAINTLDDKLDEIITKFENIDNHDDEEFDTANAIKAIQASVEAIIKYSTDIPKRLNELDAAMKQAQKEHSSKVEGRSGVIINDTMIPKKRKYT